MSEKYIKTKGDVALLDMDLLREIVVIGINKTDELNMYLKGKALDLEYTKRDCSREKRFLDYYIAVRKLEIVYSEIEENENIISSLHKIYR